MWLFYVMVAAIVACGVWAYFDSDPSKPPLQDKES